MFQDNDALFQYGVVCTDVLHLELNDTEPVTQNISHENILLHLILFI